MKLKEALETRMKECHKRQREYRNNKNWVKVKAEERAIVELTIIAGLTHPNSKR